MNAYRFYHSQSGLIRAAKRHIIKARLAKQRAERARDVSLICPRIQEHMASIADNAEKQAQVQRLLARDALMQFEQLAGRRYVLGRPYDSLRNVLSGSNFREWRDYKQTFHGLGPEREDIWS